MDNKYTIDCDESRKYDPIFGMIDSIERSNPIRDASTPFLKTVWDSMVNVNGPPSYIGAKIIPD